MNKIKLRENMIQFLKEMSTKKRQIIEDQQADLLISSDDWKRAKTIGITISQDLEWDTRFIIKQAWEEGKNVAVPKCIPETKQMQFYIIDSFDQLEEAHFSIMEPIPNQTKKITKNAMDLLLVPGLIFDQKGYRIGFGGGYYDRFLTDFKNTTVSLLSSDQLREKIPRESFDLPVQNLITEKGRIKISRGE